jgi:hypothetical protein
MLRYQQEGLLYAKQLQQVTENCTRVGELQKEVRASGSRE